MLMIEVMNAHSIVLRPVVSSEQLRVKGQKVCPESRIFTD